MASNKKIKIKKSGKLLKPVFYTDSATSPFIPNHKSYSHLTLDLKKTPGSTSRSRCSSQHRQQQQQHQQQQQQKESSKIERPKVSCFAPKWKATAVVDISVVDLKLEDFYGKYLVLFFYPLNFTFVCPTEIIAFSESVEEFKKIQTEIVGCSVDSLYSHLTWINLPRDQGGIGRVAFPLISDSTHALSKMYDVYLEESGYSMRALFIIDAKGIIRHMSINDIQVGRNVDEVIRLVKAFQHADNFDVVCPANWRPGGDTMLAHQKKIYFGADHDYI